jgi:hypothetical protein
MIMWKIISEKKLPLNEFSTLSEAMLFAKGYGTFVTITDGTTEIVGKFGVASVEDKVLPDGNSYTWTMRRDETHRSSRKKLV